MLLQVVCILYNIKLFLSHTSKQQPFKSIVRVTSDHKNVIQKEITPEKEWRTKIAKRNEGKPMHCDCEYVGAKRQAGTYFPCMWH